MTIGIPASFFSNSVLRNIIFKVSSSKTQQLDQAQEKFIGYIKNKVPELHFWIFLCIILIFLRKYGHFHISLRGKSLQSIVIYAPLNILLKLSTFIIKPQNLRTIKSYLQLIGYVLICGSKTSLISYDQPMAFECFERP